MATVLNCRLVNNTDIVELELKSKKFNLTVRKKEALKAAEPVIQVCLVLGHRNLRNRGVPAC